MLRHLTDALIAWGPAGILLLSILDSAGVPVAGVFDALLVLIAVQRPGVAWLCAGLAVAGSTIGNTILFWTAHRGGRRFINKAEPEDGGRFRRWFKRYGLITVFIPALIPIPMPLKLFVISAGVLGTSRTAFISVVLVARIVRYFGEAWLGVTLGRESTKFLTSHAWHFVVGAALLFVVLYLFVLLRERSRARANL